MAKKEDFKYVPQLTPSQFDNYLFGDWKAPISDFYDYFHIEKISNYKNHLAFPILPHRRMVNFIVFLTKGCAIRSKGLNTYQLRENTIFCLGSDQITTLDYYSDDIEGYYCHFKTEIFNQPLLKIAFEKDFPFFQITSNPIIEIQNADRLILLFQLLENENKLNLKNRFTLIPLYLAALLSEIKLMSNTQAQKVNNSAFSITESYKKALSEFVYEKKTIREFADLLAVSPNHLHKCVKIATGKSAHDLLDEMRILEAKVLLKQTDLSIGDIAFKIGKFDPSDFSRFFKLKTNLTPLQYRNNDG